MNHLEFTKAKQHAREQFGPGTLVCHISAEDLAKVYDEGPLDDMHEDIFYRIQPLGKMRFTMLDETGPYMDT